VIKARHYLDGLREQGRGVEAQGLFAPHHTCAFLENQYQCEGGQHLGHVVALVQPSKDQNFEDDPCYHGCCHRQQQTQPERIGSHDKRRSEIRAQHVKGTVGKVDEIHDAEDERQARRQQEQHEAELEPVQRQLDQQRQLHSCLRCICFKL